jgi:hypothetical protein
MAIKTCKECGENISSKIKGCPNCGFVRSHQYGCLCVLCLVLMMIVFHSIQQNEQSGTKTPIASSQMSTIKTETPEEIRKKRISHAFSSWDGSHRGLESTIKKAMNDPNSFEHVQTTYSDNGNYLTVAMVYRGKNLYGGMVKNRVVAKADLDGNVLNIISDGQ